MAGLPASAARSAVRRLARRVLEIDRPIVEAIDNAIEALPFWQKLRSRAPVVLVGSLAAGLADRFSDVDVHVLVPRRQYRRLYEPYWDAVDHGAVEIMNPRARLFHEYPLTSISELKGAGGHFQFRPLEEILAQIHALNDVVRWIYSNSVAISDPRSLHAEMRALASEYPPGVAREKRGKQLFRARDSFYNLKIQLSRDHCRSIMLLSHKSISHVLKYCCLCDGNPFPYGKWLYQVAAKTSLGLQIRHYVDAIMAETRKEHVVHEKPDFYVRPGHRNEQYEDYRIYHLFMLLFEAIDMFRRDRFPDEVK